MFDNYTEAAALIADAASLKERYPHVIIEASGGITSLTLPSFCAPSVDVVSVGRLTLGYGIADFSLKVAIGEGIAGIAKVLASAAAK
jgi:nicotinate-nucleotide pyrophosphorylase (carboxylating)